MEISFDNKNIYFKSYDQAEIRLLDTYKPYKIGKTGTKFVIPLTLESFEWTFNIFPLEKNDSYWKTLLMLEASNTLTKNLFSESRDPDLRPYQYQGVLWLNFTLDNFGAAGLFWDPRTGKTRTTVKATSNYAKVLVLSLAGQEDNWLSTYTDYSKHTKIFSLHKKSPLKRRKIYEEFLKEPHGVLIGSMNTLSADALNPLNGLNLRGTKTDIMVFDEIHKIKNHSTALHKGAKMLRNSAKKVLGLTGTPVSKSSFDVAGIITFLFNQFSATQLKEYFFEQQASYYNTYGTATVVKKEKEEEWLNFMNLMFSSIKKEAALPWASVPEKLNIHLYAAPKQYKMYNDCLMNMELQRNESDIEQIQEVIVQMKRLQQISCSPELLNPFLKNESVKEKWLLEFIANKDNYDGLIIFTTHSSYIPSLKEKIEALGISVGTITGKTKNKIVEQDKFQNKEYEIIICNIQAGSKGITLDVADTMVFLDRDWKPDENKQAEERFIATTPEKEKLRKIYNLSLSDSFKVDPGDVEETLGIDVYMEQVLSGKIKQTEIINMFKELWLKNN